MPTLPTGVITALFTDIQGSTRLWQSNPEAMHEAIARHHALLQNAVESHTGYVFQIVGDSFCTAFTSAAEALAAALDAQRALRDEPWPTATPLRVRMALDTGPVEARAGN